MNDNERKAFMDGRQDRVRGYVAKALADPAIKGALHRRTLSRYADDKSVNDFAKVCEQQGVAQPRKDER